jgi:hypothetical protein
MKTLHTAYRVGDLERSVAQKGIGFDGPQHPAGENGPKTAWVRDPDGYRIEQSSGLPVTLTASPARTSSESALTFARVSEPETCSICGRTILKGERTHAYLSPDGERRLVCDLCRGRAEAVGWSPANAGGGPPPMGRRRRRSVSALLRERAGARARRTQAGAGETPGRGEGARSPDPAARGAGVGRTETIPESPRSRLDRAVTRFNSSPHARTVAGLMRTLGPPWVSVGAAAGTPSEIRITVAWELSWYQWGVDIASDTSPVVELDKGHEVSQLDGPARQWNAHAAEGGQLRLGTSPEAEA